MMVFQFLAAVVFLFVGAFLRLMMFPTLRTPPKHSVCGRLPRLGVKKQRKRWRVTCKSKSNNSIIFKPKFEKKQRKTEPKLIYMAFISKSSTVVFFRDLYHTIESKSDLHVGTSRRLFDIYLPKKGENYISPPVQCKGWFILATANSVLVCNPTTKQAITLPQSSNKHTPRIELKENEGLNVRVGFGFVQSTQAYKVAQFFYRSYNFKEQRYSMGFEVFTIGISECWRVVADDPPYPIWNSCSTFAGKCMYFYIWHPIAPYAPNAFLCFHLRNEKFSLLHPPYSLRYVSVHKMMLTNLEGRLCLSALYMNNTKFSVFTTTKQGTNVLEWTPRFSFNMALQPEMDVLVKPIAEYGERLLIHVDDKENPRSLEFYNPKDGSFEQLNGESEDLKMTKEGFKLFVKKPWFYVSSYQDQSLFKLF